MPHPPYGGHDGQVTWTALVERDSHSKLHSVLSDLAVTWCQLQSCCPPPLLHCPLCMTTVSAHTTTVPLTLCFRRLQHWLTYCSHSRDSCYPSEYILLLSAGSCDSTYHGLYCTHAFAPTQHRMLQHLPFRCLPSFSFSSQMEEQQNVQQPPGTTWWNHFHFTGIRPSALHCLQQLQAGASSTSSAQPLASTQESNGTASSGSVPSPQLPHSAISPQVPAGPTRNVTGKCNVSYAL